MGLVIDIFMRNKDLFSFFCMLYFLGHKGMTTTKKKFHPEFILIEGRDVEPTSVNKVRFKCVKSQKAVSMVRKHSSMIRDILQRRCQFLAPKTHDHEIQACGSWSKTFRLFQAIWMLHCYHPGSTWHALGWWNSAQGWIWFCARNYLRWSRYTS